MRSERSGGSVALLTIKQAAERLNVSEATVYDLCAKRKLPHVRIGTGRGTIRIDEQALEEFIKAATVPPAEPTAPPPPPKQGGKPTVFTHLDQDRLREAWRRQGALTDRPGGGSAPSSA